MIAVTASLALLLTACSNRDNPSPTPAATNTEVSSPTVTTPANNSSVLVTPTPGAPTAVEGAAEHDGARTLDLLRQLSVDIGTRVSGTSGEDKAVDFIAAQFARLGYSVEVTSFEFDSGGFSDEGVLLDGKAYDGRRFNGSGSAEVSAPGAYVGLADAAGLAGKDLTGKIAVADRGTLTFTAKAQAVEKAGAVGLVIINNEPGLIAGRLEPASPIPVVGIGFEDGPAFKSAITEGKRISLAVAKFTAKNVLAKPAANTTCDILVGGHHDSVPGTPGATDNASGTATVLELARAFAVGGLEPGLCFATFGAEESGLHGSEFLAEQLDDSGDLPRIYVNLDVTGTGTQIDVVGTRDLVDRAVDLADSLDINAVSSTVPAGTSSDHASFQRVGVDVVYFASDDYSKIHTPSDTLATIDAVLLDDTGDLAYAFILSQLRPVAQG